MLIEKIKSLQDKIVTEFAEASKLGADPNPELFKDALADLDETAESLCKQDPDQIGSTLTELSGLCQQYRDQMQALDGLRQAFASHYQILGQKMIRFLEAQEKDILDGKQFSFKIETDDKKQKKLTVTPKSLDS